MPGSGSGTGTPILVPAPSLTTPIPPSGPTAVTLAQYALRVGYRECAFFGVNHPDNPNYACGAVWTGAQRAMIAWALAEAQEEIEQEIGYFLSPQWVANERQPWTMRLFTHWGHVIEGGVLVDSFIGNSLPVNYGADPAIVTTATGGCAVEDMHVYHEDTGIEIIPTSIVIAGGVAVISIPWCRLVAPAYEDTDEQGLDYSDVATWGAAHVDVRCRSTDATDQATLVWRGSSCTPPCADTRKAACIYVREERLGIIEALPATYTAGAWARLCVCGNPDWALLNYKSGLQTLTKQAEDAIIRLAHAKMPEEPCGCATTQALWKRDRNVPNVLTRERINNPFGEMNDGAWVAFRWSQTMKIVRSMGNL